MKYSKEIDKKWQDKWREDGLYKYNPNSEKEKFYTMEMLPYPSGAKLHLGHWFNFAPADSFARFKKMQGYNVFHPKLQKQRKCRRSIKKYRNNEKTLR